MIQVFKNKRAVGPVGAIILFMFFLVFYFVWLANFLSVAGANYIAVNNATGLEAFFYSNLNVWVVLCMILGMLAWNYFGGQQ